MRWHFRLLAFGMILTSLFPWAQAQESGLPEALNAREWARVEASVDKGLAWLAKQQLTDGSFEARDLGQPAITSFAVMAYLSRGHRPGSGPYGKAAPKRLVHLRGCATTL